MLTLRSLRLNWHFALFCLALLLASSTDIARAQSPTHVCTNWTPVNDGAFGLGPGHDGSYGGEEGFEVLVFKHQLYLGMEADNSLGARLWRTRAGVAVPSSQADWEEVAADAVGNPFGNGQRQENPPPGSGVFLLQNDHIDSLAAFDGYLYASTANGGDTTQGTLVYRSPSGSAGTWTQVNTPGFGDIYNTNFKDMQVFQGWLCGGTQNRVTGAQVWCTVDGTTWSQKNFGGFGLGVDDNTNVEVWSGYVYNGALYFGVQNTGANRDSSVDDVARLFRTTDLGGTPTWTEVYSGTAGSRRVDILGALNGYLYISVRSSEGIVILRSPSGDAGSWTQVNTAGMNGNPQNFGAVVDSATVYNGALYVGVANVDTGFEVWRTAGIQPGSGPLVDWVQVGSSGLGDPNNSYTELIPFNGYLYAWTSNYATGQQVLQSKCPVARNVILLIADGWGSQHIAAANQYTANTPAYQSWARYWMTTFAAGGSYDPTRAWTDFSYVTGGATDSAAAATALYSGVKTANGHISVSADGATRLFTIGDKARSLGKAVGAVSSVYLSHATPGAWVAHNDNRNNGYAIADEGLWGNPNTTGTGGYYSGGHGNTRPPADVLIGAGHPDWGGANYVNVAIRNKLAAENGSPGAFTFVERIAGSSDGGARLLNAARDPAVTRLAGLFGGPGGNLDWRLANGSGYNPENPTLAEMAKAALTVLNRQPSGFVLMIEGGAIDWASHANNMNQMIGEQIDFNNAVQAVVDWVEDPANGSSWENTLVIVTGDHETGYLTAGPGVFANQLLGEVSERTLGLEKPLAGSSRRASWEDIDGDSGIDPGETVYWAWHSGSHTNSLIPLFAKGAGAELFAPYATATDAVRGPYLDNTDVFKVMDAVTLNFPTCPNFVSPATVGVEDIQATAALWREQSGDKGWEDRFDLDGDGDVDMVDLMWVAWAWGMACRYS